MDVHLDGQLWLSLRVELVASAHLDVGTKLPASRLRELQSENQRLNAHAAALRLLAAAPRSKQELRRRLRLRGLPEPAVEDAVARMEQLGYLDDDAFARSFVEGRQASTPRAGRALRFELSRKGVSSEVAALATETVSDAEAALEAAQRRLRTLGGLDKQAFSRKLGSFLASRGFSYSTARAVIARCWAELEVAKDENAASFETVF